MHAEDVAVRFYEQDDEGNLKWEDYGAFSPQDVHRQVRFICCVQMKNDTHPLQEAYQQYATFLDRPR